MNKKFVLEDERECYFIDNDCDYPKYVYCEDDIKQFLQLLKEDFKERDPFYPFIWKIIEKRAGKSLVNTHPKEQTKSYVDEGSMVRRERNDTLFSLKDKTAPEGVHNPQSEVEACQDEGEHCMSNKVASVSKYPSVDNPKEQETKSLEKDDIRKCEQTRDTVQAENKTAPEGVEKKQEEKK